MKGGLKALPARLRHRVTRFVGDELPAYYRCVATANKPGVLLFAQGRSGTWLLHSMLNQHPQIAFDKEILEQRVIAPLPYTIGLAARAASDVYGCHVQINQLLATQKTDPRVYLSGLVSRGWKIVHLSRDDIVRQSISAIVAVQRGKWVSRKNCEKTPECDDPIAVDIDRVIRRIQRRMDHRAIEQELLADLPHLALNYETDLASAETHQQCADKVFKYLGLESRAICAGTRRINPSSMQNTLTNAEALQRRIEQEFPNLPFISLFDPMVAL